VYRGFIPGKTRSRWFRVMPHHTDRPFRTASLRMRSYGTYPCDGTSNCRFIKQKHAVIQNQCKQRIPDSYRCKIRVQVLFHPPVRVLFTFPSRYLFLSSLASVQPYEWFSQTHRISLSHGTRDTSGSYLFRLRGIHALWLTVPGHSANRLNL